MRQITLWLIAGCVLPALAIAADGEGEQKLRSEAMQGNDMGGRQHQHWLYDKEYQPATTGEATARQPCKGERVRVSRGDGTTTVTRIDKCQ
jgi:hypothetical protein